MTGRPFGDVGSSGISGVQMFRVRQSSLWTSSALGSDGLVMPAAATLCGAIGPNEDASRTPVQGSGGCGGRHRRSPAGDRA